MKCFRWIFHSFVIYLHINSVHTQSDKIVECGWYDSINLQFYCRGSAPENNNKDSYFCCTDKIHCVGDSNIDYKSNFGSIEFTGCKFSRLKYKYI